MPTDRQIQEMVARCESCMVFYLNSGKAQRHKNVIASEVQAVAHLVAEWGLGGQAVEVAILHPVKAGMVARYGAVEGGKLFGEFATAFHLGVGPGLELTLSPA
jgi:hypothetical protein